MSELGERIRARRRDLGVTLEQLGEAIGRDKSAMSRIEKGERNVRSGELRAIAERLDVSVRELLGMRVGSDRLAVAYRLGRERGDDDASEAIAMVKRVLEVEHTLAELEIPDAPGPARRVSVTAPEGAPAQQGRAAAEELRVELALGDAPVHDLVDLVEDLGIDVLRAPLPEGVSGLCVRAGGAVLIAVNTRHVAGHQRFTLAHELAHASLDTDEEFFLDFDSQTHTAGAERRAHAFAAHLLMPEGGLRYHLGSREVDDAAFADLLFTFDVSSAALRNQLEAFGLVSAAQKQQFADDRYNPKPLALRYGHLDKWRQNQSQRGLVEPPRRMWQRAVDAYQQGRLGAGPLSVLAGQDPEELERELASDGVAPDFADLYPRPFESAP